jgi:hypothetical protein
MPLSFTLNLSGNETANGKNTHHIILLVAFHTPLSAITARFSNRKLDTFNDKEDHLLCPK